LEDRLGIMVGDGKAAFGRRRSADAANREAYEEYNRHFCSGDGGHAGLSAAAAGAGEPAVRLEPQSPYRRR